jgi:hypothetical protein
MTDFRPIDGSLVVQNETQATFSLSSAYVVNVHTELWAEDQSWMAQPTDTALDGQNDQNVVFQIPQTDLHYRLTVTGESGSQNTVYVSIDWE